MIDFYLSPLIEDLKLLWDWGVEGFNGFANENFKIHVMLFCTINDFPVYENLSKYNVKAHKTCLICDEDITSQQLKHGRKKIYIRHRRFLRSQYPY